MTSKETLREEFQKWVEQSTWQGEDKFTKNIAVGNVADWWLSKLEQIRNKDKKRLIENVGTMKKLLPENPPNASGLANNLIQSVIFSINNEIIDKVLDLIKQDEKEL